MDFFSSYNNGIKCLEVWSFDEDVVCCMIRPRTLLAPYTICLFYCIVYLNIHNNVYILSPTKLKTKNIFTKLVSVWQRICLTPNFRAMPKQFDIIFKIKYIFYLYLPRISIFFSQTNRYPLIRTFSQAAKSINTNHCFFHKP